MKWLVEKIKKLLRIKKPSSDRVASRDEHGKRPFSYLMRVPDLPSLKTKYDLDHGIYYVHVTAGWRNQSATSFMKNFLDRGLCTDFMEDDGTIFCQRDWDRGGSHLGKAFLNNNPKGKKLHSRTGAGIEIACGGKLEVKDGKFYTWFGKEVPQFEAHYHTDGSYHELMTDEQKNSLARFLRDIRSKHPGIKFYSHDEVSGYRGKSDVGGALGMSFRKFLEQYVY